MNHSLERITTEYIDAEDRIRLAGEVPHGASVTVWLTLRLLQRLLPVLLKWLDRQDADIPRNEVLQSFAQQAAISDLTPQKPVQPGAGSSAWLAMAVDITQSEEAISLTFRGVDGQRATLTLSPKSLRQWLGIVHNIYLKAEWPLDLWPGWIRESALPASGRAVMFH